MGDGRVSVKTRAARIVPFIRTACKCRRPYLFGQRKHGRVGTRNSRPLWGAGTGIPVPFHTHSMKISKIVLVRSDKAQYSADKSCRVSIKNRNPLRSGKYWYIHYPSFTLHEISEDRFCSIGQGTVQTRFTATCCVAGRTV